MATALDSRAAQVVTRALAKFGKLVEITVKTNGTFNPATGAVTGETSTAYSVLATPPKAVTEYQSNDLLKNGDVTISIHGVQSFSVAVGQLVKIDGVSWTIVTFESIYSGELVALTKLYLRR